MNKRLFSIEKSAILIFCCALFLMVLPLVSASTPGNISTCQTLDTPGFYNLTNNISATGTCFIINSSNVTFNGNNYALLGDSNISNAHYAFYAYNGTNISVMNVSMRDFNSFGILFSNVNYSTISGVLIGYSVGTQTPPFGPANYTQGLYVHGCNYNNITQNTFRDNGAGLNIDGTSNFNFIYNNTVTNNSNYGMDFWGRFDTVFSNNFSYNNRSIQSSRSTVPGGEFANLSNNLFIGNGIGYYHAIDNSTFTNNIIANSTTWGLELAGVNNTFSNNTFVNNINYQIKIASGTQHNYLTGNNLSANNSLWINQEGGGKGTSTADHNFSLMLFENTNGSVFMVDLVNLPSATAMINSTYIRINQNNASIDVSSASYLNKSSVITLYGLAYRNPSVLRNSLPCSISICSNLQSLSGNRYSFNVSSFSWYSLIESGPLVQLTKINGTLLNNSSLIYSYSRDRNLTIDVNVSDLDSASLILDINYSTNSSNGTGNNIFSSINLSTLSNTGNHRCNDTNFSDVTECSFDWNISEVSDGNYYLHSSLSDGLYFNTNSSNYSIMIDNSAPSISIISPSSGSTKSSSSVSLTYNVTDLYSGVKNIWVSQDGSTWINNYLNSSYTFTGQSDGTKTYYVRATDNADNNRSESVQFTISTSSGSSNGIYYGTVWIKTYNLSSSILSQGIEKELSSRERLLVKVNNKNHFVGIVDLTTISAKIQVESTPQQATLQIGENKSFDVDNDGKKDITVKLLGIDTRKAIISITNFNESKAVQSNNSVSTEDSSQSPLKEEANNSYLRFIVFSLLLLIVIFYLYSRRKDMSFIFWNHKYRK